MGIDDPLESSGYILWQLTHTMQQRMTVALRDLDLNLPQLGTLVHLARSEASSTADLSRMTLMTPQNMSLAVSKLVGAGYVVRQPHETHGRINRLAITREGLRVVRRAVARVVRVENEMLRGVTRAERDHLTATLRRCLEQLKAPTPSRRSTK
jgi:DNA-binding MarR family transcriptional regulator